MIEITLCQEYSVKHAQNFLDNAFSKKISIIFEVVD